MSNNVFTESLCLLPDGRTAFAWVVAAVSGEPIKADVLAMVPYSLNTLFCQTYYAL